MFVNNVTSYNVLDFIDLYCNMEMICDEKELKNFNKDICVTCQIFVTKAFKIQINSEKIYEILCHSWKGQVEKCIEIIDNCIIENKF